MLRRLLDRFRSDPNVQDELYDSIVAAARQPRLYEGWGVPDTPAGRIEMVVVHTAVATYALMAQGSKGEARARALNERFVTDMDDNMREIGVGDLTVPKKVKKAAAAVYDRIGLIDKLAGEGAKADGAKAGAVLIEIEGERLDKAVLGRYFLRLINDLGGNSGERLLVPGGRFPAIADEMTDTV